MERDWKHIMCTHTFWFVIIRVLLNVGLIKLTEQICLACYNSSFSWGLLGFILGYALCMYIFMGARNTDGDSGTY